MKLNFEYGAQLQKAGQKKGNKIPITIIPNAPTADRVNDTIHLKAFADPECRNDFVKEGIIDYDHESVRAKTKLEKSIAIIGQPEDLFVDKKRNLPFCNAYLFANNPYVEKSIIPALEAGSTVFGASVGGRMLKSSPKDPVMKKAGNDIYKISLKHIAICPVQNAIHGSTAVSLRKSFEDEEDVFHFKSILDFFKSFDDDTEIQKALVAGMGTDSADLTGGQVLQTQSLEGDKGKGKKHKKKKKSEEVLKAILPFYLEAVVEKRMDPTTSSHKLYLLNKGLSEADAMELIKTIAINSYKIAEKIKN